VTCETCPQYLALDLDDQVRLGPYAASAPALRSRELVEELWQYVLDGTIDAITSDHCAYTASSKDAGLHDIWAGRLGVSAVQTLLPVLLTEGTRRGISLERISALFSTMPARLWGLDDRKGAIKVGLDADLALIDPEREWVLEKADLLHTHKWSPFEGWSFHGRVVRTILRGVTVFRDDLPERIQVQPGFGQWLRRRTSDSAGPREDKSSPRL
jgi:allantoinase